MKENMRELIEVPDFYNEPTEGGKDALLNLMRTLNALSYEELDAIGGEIEMTEDMFEHCLLACINTDNFRLFEDIWSDFPDLNAVIALKVYETLDGSEMLKFGDIKNKFINTVLQRIKELSEEGFCLKP
ncbi:MAG: hypothetical protein ACLRJC_10060 [Emergencia timonensis]|uniref:hypothetical protein n=1 Tax=Emergencia timonensis TaxID=1776384 RepID=UPI000836AFC1|nr:hypothetical protein [Emergencia timonensis]WNX89954.1 hypothetical protein RVY71_06670 [Emergencia timonensis]